MIGQARSTQRYQIKVPDDEPRLIQRIIELATQYGRVRVSKDHGSVAKRRLAGES